MRGRRWRGTEGVSSGSYAFFLRSRAPAIPNPSLPTCQASQPPAFGGVPPTDPKTKGRPLRTSRSHQSCCPCSPGVGSCVPQGEAAAPAPVKGAAAIASPGKALATSAPGRLASPHADPRAAPVSEGAREAAWCGRVRGQQPRSPNLVLHPPGPASRPRRPRPAPRAQPRSYRGVSGEAAAAALERPRVRCGLGASPAAVHTRAGPGPAARSAVTAGARRARVPAGPAAATGALRRRRCRRLW